MGQSASSASQTAPSRALHVLRVTPASPASHTDIEPFFDFVVGYDGDSLAQNNIDVAELERIVEAHEGRTLNLMVWNSKSQETRGVSIIPSRAWSQPASPDADPHTQPSLLGLSMRICEPEFALDNVWHVLDVVEGSPAESAGLVPYGDYITGWSGGVLGAENDFYDLVEAHVEKPLRVYVYSHDFDALREVVLVPNRHWGGNGLLGCVFGYGLIHRIPPRSSTHAMPDIHEEYEDQDLFVPVDDPRYSVENWSSRGQPSRSSDSHIAIPAPLLRSVSAVSTIPEEEYSLNDDSHDHDHHSHDHDHGHHEHHGHDHGHHDHGHQHDRSHVHHEPASESASSNSHLPITPILTPSPSSSNLPPSRPFLAGGKTNGSPTSHSFSQSSRSSTPVMRYSSYSYTAPGKRSSEEVDSEEDDGESNATDATSQGSLTSVD